VDRQGKNRRKVKQGICKGAGQIGATNDREVTMKPKKEETGAISRRSVLAGSALILSGGIAGRISSAYSAPAPTTPAPAPPLPWKWVKLDPLEAGRRAYRGYLTGGG
jgi:hypothetical protein